MEKKPLHEIMAQLLSGGKLEEDNVVGKQNTSITVDKEVKDQNQEAIDTANIIKSAPTREDPNDKKREISDADVDGIADGILVVTDPEISSEEFEEVADELQGIVDNSDGELPFTDKYEGDYILSCPICGGTFVHDTLLDSGEDTCPICCKIPDAFVVNGRIESEEAAIEQDDVQEDIEHEENLEEPIEDEVGEMPIDEPELEDIADATEEDPAKKESKEVTGNKLQESKLEEDEYDDYLENEKALSADYCERAKKGITQEARVAFADLKDILDTETNDTSVDGFYFPSKAVAIILNSKEQHHLNPYMDLTVSNILNLVDDNDTIEGAIDELFADYKADSALGWADNFVTVLGKLSFDLIEDEDWEVYDWNYKEDSDGDIIEGAGKIGNQEFVFEASREDNMIDFYDFESGETLDITDDELCNYILNLLNGLEENKKLEEAWTDKDFSDDIDDTLTTLLGNIYQENGIETGDISPEQSEEFDEIVSRLNKLFNGLCAGNTPLEESKKIEEDKFENDRKIKELLDKVNQLDLSDDYEEVKEIEKQLKELGHTLTKKDLGIETNPYAGLEELEEVDEGKKLEEGNDTAEATEIFVNGLDKAVQTQEIVNAECMDEMLKNANGILKEVADEQGVLLEGKEKKEEYIETGFAGDPFDKHDFEDMTDLEAYIKDHGYELLNGEHIEPDAMKVEVFDPAGNDGEVYVYDIAETEKGVTIEMNHKDSFNMNESKKMEEAPQDDLLTRIANKQANRMSKADGSGNVQTYYSNCLNALKDNPAEALKVCMLDFEGIDERDIPSKDMGYYNDLKELQKQLNESKKIEEAADPFEYTENIEDAKKFKSSKSAGNFLDKHWGIVKNEDTYSNSLICQEDGNWYIGFNENSYSDRPKVYLKGLKKTEGKLEESEIKYDYFDSDEMSDLGSDAEIVEALFLELGMEVDETWDNVGEAMDNEYLKIATINGKSYIVYNDGTRKGYSLGRANDNMPIVKTGDIEKELLKEEIVVSGTDEQIEQAREDSIEKGLCAEEKLVEEKVVWDSEPDYVMDIDNQDFREWFEANGYDENLEGEDEETQEAILRDYLEMYNETDNEVIMEDWQENIMPMLENQLDENDLMIMLGSAQTWRGTNNAGKILRGMDDFQSLVADYDEIRLLINDEGGLAIELVHHDGTHRMNLYTFNGDTEGVYNKLIDLGMNEFADDYEDFDDASSYYDAGDLLDYLLDGHQEEMKEFLVSLKWNV